MTDDSLTQLPKKRFKIINLIWLIVLIAGLFISINVTNTHISVLLENFSQFSDIFVQMANPDWSYFPTVIPLLLETIKMAVLGTIIGSALAFVYSLLIARNIIKNKLVTGVLRFIMNIIRTIPDLLLGAIFVAIVGIGPVAGILALSVFTFGVVVKLFYEA
ncbi:PhnE/PtxC family ABC transporter permease, partial [Lactobacillus acetotolerans]